MKAAPAKYLFDEDFATGAKPDHQPWSRPSAGAPTPSGQAYRKGFAAGQAQGAGGRRAARRRRARRRSPTAWRGIERAASPAIETRLETEAVEVAVAVGAQARARN